MMLSVAVTAIFLTLMPDTVPMHYNIKGEIDRYGSKYENLIMPVSMILLGVLFLLLARHFRKRQQLENQRVVLASGSVLLGFLNVLFAYFLRSSASFAPNLTDTTTDSIIFQITTIGLGFMLMILGYLMPQTSLNGIVGLRTVWSMKNEKVWQKSQKAGGIIMSACGVSSVPKSSSRVVSNALAIRNPTSIEQRLPVSSFEIMDLSTFAICANCA